MLSKPTRYTVDYFQWQSSSWRYTCRGSEWKQISPSRIQWLSSKRPISLSAKIDNGDKSRDTDNQEYPKNKCNCNRNLVRWNLVKQSVFCSTLLCRMSRQMNLVSKWKTLWALMLKPCGVRLYSKCERINVNENETVVCVCSGINALIQTLLLNTVRWIVN